MITTDSLDEQQATFRKGQLGTSAKLKAIGLVAVVVLGVFLRWEAVQKTQVSEPIIADAKQYMAAAYNLAKYGVYSERTIESDDGSRPDPTAQNTPGFPVWASFFTDPDDIAASVDRIVAANAVLSILSLIVLAVIFFRILSYWACLAALALVAVNPHLINLNIYLLTESLFILGVACLYGVAWAFTIKPDLAKAAILGLIAGLTYLVRPSVLPLVVPVIILIGVTLKGNNAWKAAATMLLVFATIALSWNVRNLISVGALSESNGAANFLHHGMYPGFEYKGLKRTFGYPYQADPKSEQLSGNVAYIIEEIESRFSREPGKHIRWYLTGKPAFLHSWATVAGQHDIFIYPVQKTPYADSVIFDVSNKVSYYAHGPAVALAFLGVFFVWLPSFYYGLSSSKKRFFQFTSLLLIFYTGFHIIGAPFPRYGVPVRPFIYVMGLFVIAGFLRHARELVRNG